MRPWKEVQRTLSTVVAMIAVVQGLGWRSSMCVSQCSSWYASNCVDVNVKGTMVGLMSTNT